MNNVDYLEGCLINAVYLDTEIYCDLFDSYEFCVKKLLKELKDLGYRLFGETSYENASLLYIKNEYVFPVKQEDTDDIIYYYDKDGWSKDSIGGYVKRGIKEFNK